MDSAHLLRWVPFLSLLFLMMMQTIFVTRYVSGLESSNTQLVATVAEIRAELKALSSSVHQGSIPSAQNQWRIEQVERQLGEAKQSLSDLSRRTTAIETNMRPRDR